MSIEVSKLVWRVSLPAHQKFLLLALADFAKSDGTSVFPSQRKLAQMVSKSERSVRTTLQQLRDLGVIVRVQGHRGGGSYRRADEYVIQLDALTRLAYPTALQHLKPKAEVPAGQTGSGLPPIHQNHQDPSERLDSDFADGVPSR